MLKNSYMLHTAGIRDDRIRYLAMRLKKDQLSSDEFQKELASLTRAEQAVLVEFLADLANGPVEVDASSAGFNPRYSGRSTTGASL